MTTTTPARPGLIRRAYNRVNPRGISNTQFAIRVLSVLAVVVIGTIALNAAGSGNEFIIINYPVIAKWIIFFLNIGLLVGVLADLILSKRWQQPASLVVPSLLLVSLLLIIALFWDGWLGVATQAVLTGPFGAAVGAVGGFAALVLNGWLVWRIWGLGHTSPEVASRQAIVERLRGQLTPLQDIRDTADGLLKTAVQAKAARTTELADAEGDLTEANKRLLEKQTAFDAAHKATIEAAKTRVSNAQAELSEEQKLLANFESRSVLLKRDDPIKYNADRNPLAGKVTLAEDEVIRAEQALRQATTDTEATAEGTALASEKSEVEAAEKAVSTAQTALGGATTDHAAKESAFKTANGAFTDKEKELQGAEAGYTTHQLRANSARRGWIFGTILLFAGMAVCYLGWFGVVLSSRV
jgi:hypothetical protein